MPPRLDPALAAPTPLPIATHHRLDSTDHSTHGAAFGTRDAAVVHLLPRGDPCEREEEGLGVEPEETNDDEGQVTPDLIRIAAVAGLGGLLFGFDTGVVSGALLSLSHDPGVLDPLSTSQESLLVTSALIGALCASLGAGKLADTKRLGRKGVIVIAAVLFALGAAEMAAAQVFKEIVLGRVLVGIGVGLASTVLPTYLAELSPPRFRGQIVSSLVVLITGGQVLAYIVDSICIRFTSGWRWMFGFGVIPALVQLVLSFSLPETPRQLLRTGKIAKARKVVKRLNPNWTPDRIQQELDTLTSEVGWQEPERIYESRPPAERSTRIDWNEWTSKIKTRRKRLVQLLWRDRANRQALIVACGLQFFQQATGFNSLMYYSTKIIQQTKLSSPATFALLIATANFVCTVIALRLIDRTGRRKLLLRGLAGMLVGMLVLSISFAFIRDDEPNSDPPTPHRAGAAAVIALIGMTGFCSAYALSLGNVPWIVQSEVFKQELKAVGTGLSTSMNWFANIFVSSTFLHISQAIGPSGAFGGFAGICLFGFGFTYYLLPETKGLSLAQVRKLFENGGSQVQVDRGTRAFSSSEEGQVDHVSLGSRKSSSDEETDQAGRQDRVGGYHVIIDSEGEDDEEEDDVVERGRGSKDPL
ncbi:uncharacterized protein JCM15063_000398 [Sporobolomyces koalae]|uniref:uncharacterized protein n=1 Tax=Sporobolomyces koalae TaxID=500713 RepID=UPI003179F85A